MIKHKIAKGVLATALAIGGTVVASTPAQALSFDCYPGSCTGNYYSTDAYAAARSHGDIQWADKGSVGVNIDVHLLDTFSDGRGPIVYVRYSNEITGATETRVRHNTDGTGSDDFYNIQFDRVVSSASRIDIQVCNGYGTDGVADYCSGWKGGFHQY